MLNLGASGGLENLVDDRLCLSGGFHAENMGQDVRQQGVEEESQDLLVTRDPRNVGRVLHLDLLLVSIFLLQKLMRCAI